MAKADDVCAWALCWYWRYFRAKTPYVCMKQTWDVCMYEANMGRMYVCSKHGMLLNTQTASALACRHTCKCMHTYIHIHVFTVQARIFAALCLRATLLKSGCETAMSVLQMPMMTKGMSVMICSDNTAVRELFVCVYIIYIYIYIYIYMYVCMYVHSASSYMPEAHVCTSSVNFITYTYMYMYSGKYVLSDVYVLCTCARMYGYNRVFIQVCICT